MIAMSKDETINWLKNHNLDENNFYRYYERKLYKSLSTDSGVKNYIAKEIASIYKNNEILLYINEYGIFSSCENMYLFDGYRKSIGIDFKIYEKPTHIIKPNENIELYCLLGMVLYFFMGCIIIKIDNPDEIVCISHDESVDVYVKNNSNKNEIINLVNKIIK